MLSTRRFVFACLPALTFLFAFVPLVAHADSLTEQMARLAAQQNATVSLDSWKFHQPDVQGGERPLVDESSWQSVAPGFAWKGENTTVWFRTRYVVPERVNGLSTDGAQIQFQAGMDDDAEIYVDGMRMEKFHWDDGHIVLSNHAHPGQVFIIALRGINTAGDGALHFARVVYNLLGAVEPAYDEFVREAQFVARLTTEAASESEREALERALRASEASVDIEAIRNRQWSRANAGLASARKALMTIAPLTRQYDLYYVGHAHIDMNWQWPWSETIDVCHRTWDSAMNLMDAFPDFGFVQSQPGAYAAVQQQYPKEFSRMQAAQKRGQWDPVGGFWDESDTNMPSGEALARSLFLGQRYFKTNFGRFATTGWLPDSFGHSWQLPQLLQGVGIDSFYHSRCGNEIPFSWWQSPDGSRVLKANTDSYDEPITAEQLVRPFDNYAFDGLKQALVVFGVGDHGGGPTRDQILAGKALQADPLAPRIHFTTADSFFKELRADRAANGLPIIDTDLQYTFTGCYTTHADMKKAVRASENNLYAGEVFSTLASMNGVSYPVEAFEQAWRPTAFAQFHDIMCGSAIHSTYDWMHEQLEPAFKFEQAQTDLALAAITRTIDTRAPKLGETPVVVWNALSFPRSDIVTVSVSDVSRVASVRDTSGHLAPVQAIDGQSLCFVARDVPGFGQRTYWLSTEQVPGAEPSSLVNETDDAIILENSRSSITIDKHSGAITNLLDKRLGRDLIAPGALANVFQILGDKGNAWDIDYTGEETDLTDDADAHVIARGPICAIVRVRHRFGASSFTQNVTFYSDLLRIDVPTTVDWHEHGELVKIAFPLSLQHTSAHVSIPYGSIDRPTDGQENPGQKWMDVTEDRLEYTGAATPLDLSAMFNHRSSSNFDGGGASYPSALMPPAGEHALGAYDIPFRFAAPGSSDNVACSGQSMAVSESPAQHAAADTIFLLAAAAPNAQSAVLTAVNKEGRRASLPFHIGDWVVGGGVANEDAGIGMPYRISPSGTHDQNKPHLWIAALRLPRGFGHVTHIVFPDNTRLHVFAITVGSVPNRKPVAGLTVLNDSKYGSDTKGSVFRLTVLRSSNDPDPNPDEGAQSFTYALLPHSGDWRDAAAEQAGLELNIPLRAVLADSQEGRPNVPRIRIETITGGSVIAGALKHAEDGPGYILRMFETQSRDSTVRLTFSQPVRVTEADLLERPVNKRKIVAQGGVVTLSVGHDQIVSLRILGLPDAGISSK